MRSSGGAPICVDARTVAQSAAQFQGFVRIRNLGPFTPRCPVLAIPDSVVATGAPWYRLRGPFLRQKRFEAGGEDVAIVLPVMRLATLNILGPPEATPARSASPNVAFSPPVVPSSRRFRGPRLPLQNQLIAWLGFRVLGQAVLSAELSNLETGRANLDEQISMGVFDVFQIPYSALQRDHENVIARASKAGAGILIRGGVARGAPSDWNSRSYYMVSSVTMRQRWEKAGLDELLGGMDRMEFMLRFTLTNPDLDTTIVGTRDPAHLHQNIEAALKGPLPEDVMREAMRRLDQAGSRSEL